MALGMTVCQAQAYAKLCKRLSLCENVLLPILPASFYHLMMLVRNFPGTRFGSLRGLPTEYLVLGKGATLPQRMLRTRKDEVTAPSPKNGQQDPTH